MSHELSIIIVNWNTRQILQECLESIRENLGGLDAQTIVFDNGSTDGSCQMVRARFPQVKLFANPTNIGFAAGNNAAIRECDGRYVLLLNSDTVVLGDVLQKSIQFMDSNLDVGVMGCRVLNTDRTVQLTCSQFPSLLNLGLMTLGLDRITFSEFFGRYHMSTWNRDSLRDVDVVTGCYMVVRREAMEQVGLLDETFFFYGEETDWCRRFHSAGWRVLLAPVGQIIHHGSISARKCNHRRDLLLTSGLVRLHLKHNGIFAAAIAWLILFAFNSSRLAFWAVRSAFDPSRPSIAARFKHFLGVVRDYRTSWPSSVPATH